MPFLKPSYSRFHLLIVMSLKGSNMSTTGNACGQMNSQANKPEGLEEKFENASG
ncbi:MAG: hypothetical protein WBL27_00060 [Salinimicrobium sp.]